MATQVLPQHEVDWLSDEEGRAFFDARVRWELGISGDEFVRRYEAGELAEFEPVNVSHLIVLRPFAGASSGDGSPS